MKYTDDIQFIEYIKQLVGKEIHFKLTDDEDDKGLTGKLLKFEESLYIECYNLELGIIVEVYEVYFIEEYKG